MFCNRGEENEYGWIYRSNGGCAVEITPPPTDKERKAYNQGRSDIIDAQNWLAEQQAWKMRMINELGYDEEIYRFLAECQLWIRWNVCLPDYANWKQGWEEKV